MSILGAVIRAHPRELTALRRQLSAFPGLSIEADPGDGRLVILIEDSSVHPERSAVATLNAVGQLPEALSLSLVYEYSGPDSAPPSGMSAVDFRSWREGREASRSASELTTARLRASDLPFPASGARS